MPKPYRYIIVGTGNMGAWWCRVTLPRLQQMGKAKIVAAVDINPEALANPIEHLGLDPKKCYTDMKKAFDENEADFAIIVTPPAFHESVVDMALAHDMDILSEKPITSDITSTCRVYKKVKAAGKKMAVTLSHRFAQDKQTLEREIKSGKYGPLNYVVCRFTNDMRKFGSWGAPFRHQIPDPLLIEGTVHHFDIFRALTGSNAKTVYTLGWNPPWGEYAGDSTAFVTVDMLNGTRCMYEGAKANATTYNGWTQEYFRAECENATLEMDRKVIKALRGGNYYERPREEEIPLLEQPAWSNEWISEMFCDWLDGGDPPPCHLDDELQCHALLFAAIESAHTGQPVDVQAFLKRHMEAI